MSDAAQEFAQQVVIGSVIGTTLDLLKERPEEAAKYLSRDFLGATLKQLFSDTAITWGADNATEVVVSRLQRMVSSAFDGRDIARVAAEAHRGSFDWSARLIAQYARESEERDTVALATTLDVSPAEGRSRVASVVISALPIPDESTPWEAIVDFRNDSEAAHALRRLNLWVRDLAAKPVVLSEVAEELNYRLGEYERFMRLHRMKLARGRLETLLLTTAEILENIVTLKFTSAMKQLFIAREREISILEAEQRAPGREIAYITTARQRFGFPNRGLTSR